MRSLICAFFLGTGLTGCLYYPHGHRGHHHKHDHDGDSDPDHGGGFGGGPGNNGGGDNGPDGQGPSSTFGEGQYAAVSLQILPEGVGRDIDGDGHADNNLPVALDALSQAVGGDTDWDPGDELRRLVDEGHMVPLIDASNRQDQLSILVMTGYLDDRGDLLVHPLSYTDDGAVRSVLDGDFCTQESFEVGPDPLWLPARVEGGVDVLLPLSQAVMVGTLNGDGGTATLTGVLRVDQLIDLVLLPWLGEDGLDIDGDGQADVGAEEVVALVEDLATDPDLADLQLADGSRGVSVGLSLVWVATEF